MMTYLTSITQLWRKHPTFFLLMLVMAVAVLPGVTQLPPMDRDEARYMQASHQMLDSGDVITIRFQDELRAKKPAGIYWLQSASAAVFGGDKPGSYRLPSILAGFGVAFMTLIFASRMMSQTQALLAATLIGISLVMVTESRLAKTDAVLTFLIMVQQFALWRIIHLHRNDRYVSGGWALMLWTALAFAILVKGPIAPAILLLTGLGFMILERRMNWALATRPLLGLIVVTLIVLPWVLLVTAATDGAFLETAIKGDFLNKLESGQESHGMPFGTHLLLLLIVLWPGSLLLGRSISGIWAHRKTPSTRFLLAWILPFWFMIEITPTKLPHYSLPVLPAIALLMACFGWQAKAPVLHFPTVSGDGKSPKVLSLILGVLKPSTGVILLEYLCLLIGPLLGGTIFVIASLYDGPMLLASLVLGLGIATAVVGWLWRRPGGKPSYLAAMLILGALFHAVTLGGVLPRMDGLHLAPRIKAELHRLDVLDKPIASAGYHEPSLVFALGEDVLLFSAEQTALFMVEAPDGTALVEAASAPEFLDILGQMQITVTAVGVIEGFNYSRGDPARIGIYRRLQ
ncbi:MAG: glycosyltransferase family 39 protein [Proteobacteria bacterium]|nr:glycosyltransferase family 39 protein [Pseudomonadota bacterium]